MFILRLALQSSMINSLKADISRLNSSMDNLKALDEMLRDEHTALQLAFSSLEDKLRHSQVIRGITYYYNINY